MGWGCQKHEWDAGSESWLAHAEKMCNERLVRTRHADWGRDGQICPKCWEEGEAVKAELLAALKTATPVLEQLPHLYEMLARELIDLVSVLSRDAPPPPNLDRIREYAAECRALIAKAEGR